MRRILLIAITVMAFACGTDSREQSDTSSGSGTGDVEEGSGENISPQLEDSADRLEVDTISSAREAQEQKENELKIEN